MFYCHWASLVAYMVESACNAGDIGSVPGLGRSPGVGNGNPLQYSCLENPKDRGAWRATDHGVAKCQAQPKAIYIQRYTDMEFYILTISVNYNHTHKSKSRSLLT